MIKSNPLLSEFGRSAFGRYMARGTWGRHACYWLIAGVSVVLWLGHRAHCNAIELRIDAQLKQVVPPFEVHASFAYGYLNELSHAFFYVLIAPAFAIVSCRFIGSVDVALAQLIRRRVLISERKDPVRRLRQWNRRSFALLTVPFSISLFVFNCRDEHAGYSVGNLGYIQAPLLQKWVDQFNDPVHVRHVGKQYLCISNEKVSADLTSAINMRLSAMPRIPAAWAPYVTLAQLDPKRPLKRDEVAAFRDAASRGPVTVDLEAACYHQMLTMTASRSGGPESPSANHGWWRAFVVVLLTYEGMFHAFCIWMAVKVLCTLVFLCSAFVRCSSVKSWMRRSGAGCTIHRHWKQLSGNPPRWAAAGKRALSWSVRSPSFSGCSIATLALSAIFGLLAYVDLSNVIEVVAWAVLYPMFVFLVFLPAIRSNGARVRPLLTDPTKRFGIEELHPVYNAVALLLLLGGLVASLSFTSNAAKGTEFLAGAHSVTYSSQFIIMIGVVVVSIGILVGPMTLFALLLGGRKGKRMRFLQTRMGEPNANYAVLVQQKDLVSQQTTWPRDDARFKNVAALVVVFLILPWASSLGILPDRFAEASNVIAWSRAATLRVSHYIYDVPEE
jgi:hypothetical protein